MSNTKMDKSCYINKIEYQTTMKMNNNNKKKTLTTRQNDMNSQTVYWVK